MCVFLIVLLYVSCESKVSTDKDEGRRKAGKSSTGQGCRNTVEEWIKPSERKLTPSFHFYYLCASNNVLSMTFVVQIFFFPKGMLSKRKSNYKYKNLLYVCIFRICSTKLHSILLHYEIKAIKMYLEAWEEKFVITIIIIAPKLSLNSGHTSSELTPVSYVNVFSVGAVSSVSLCEQFPNK